MPTPAETMDRALELHKRGQLAQAEAMYRQLLVDVPGHPDATHYLGMVSLQRGRWQEALPLLEQAVALRPRTVEYVNNLASAYRMAGRPEDGVQTFDRAIALDPRRAPLHYNRGLCLFDLGRLEEAAASYRQAIELEPDYAMALNNLGNTEKELGQLDRALVSFDRALTLNPDYADAHYNRSLVLLSLGRWTEGFAENEWRLQIPDLGPRNLPRPAWQGQALEDQTLLVYAEQGLGDTMQWVRYLPLVGQRCRRVYVEVPGQLVPLLSGSGYTNLVPRGQPLPPFDVQVSLASLPHRFGTTPDAVPAGEHSLRVEARRVDRWKSELARYDGYQVGICWQGSHGHARDRWRSIPLSCFEALARVPGVRLVSLQKGPGTEQISAVAGRFHVVDLGNDFDGAAGAFVDTAAIMNNLDLVVTCDSAVAHLAGALGVPVWVPLRLSPDWRWLTERSDTPWYPTMRLFRQRAFGDWGGVFVEMAEALAARGGNSR